MLGAEKDRRFIGLYLLLCESMSFVYTIRIPQTKGNRCHDTSVENVWIDQVGTCASGTVQRSLRCGQETDKRCAVSCPCRGLEIHVA